MVKKVIAFVGCAGAGKSTYAHEKGFEDFVLSADSIREEIGCATINEDGTGHIDQSRNKEVFEIFHQRYEERLSAGLMTVVDNTNLNLWSLKDLKAKADKYGFSFEIVKFDISLETLLDRNTKRGYKNVPNEVVRNMYERLQNLDLSRYYIANIVTEADQK